MISFLLLLVNSISADCPKVVQIATGLGMKTYEPAILFNLTRDCCFGYGIDCDSKLRVVNITWPDLTLYGSVSGDLLPSSLKKLSIPNFNINYDLTVIPPGLNYLLVSGPVDITAFPASINTIILDYSTFSSPLPLLPSTVTLLSCYFCKGLTALPTMPIAISTYIVSYTFLNGSFPTVPNTVLLPDTMTYFDISYNSLSGQVPGVDLTNLPYFAINNNNFFLIMEVVNAQYVDVSYNLFTT